MTVYLAWYGCFPDAVVTVGVFESQDLALEALGQSDGPPESYHVSPLFLNHRYELRMNDGY